MAIDFSQVRVLKIQNEAYRQLEYIKLKNGNYFNLGSTSQGLYREFDINVGVPTGATSYPFFGYAVNDGKSVNEVTIYNHGGSFTYGRGSDATVAFAQIYSGALMHNKRRIVKAYVRDDKKSVIEIYDTEGTLLKSATSTKVYVNQPYASSNTGLFAAWIYRESDGKTDFRPCIETGESGIFYSYKVRVSAEGTLLENWLPAQRKADGAIGIYDTVNHRFLQPVSTTQYFGPEAGPVFDENPQWSPLVRVKQIKNANNVVLWTAAPELTSITLAGYNTSLNINSNFLYGGTVTANYSDGSTADVTLDTTFTGYDMSTAGTQTVTASYTEHGITKTATYQLTIVSGPSWHTIWEGTQTVQVIGNLISGAVNDFARTVEGTGNTPQIRVTFTMTAYDGQYASTYYYTNSSDYSTSTKPSSPYTRTISSARTTILGVGRHGSYDNKYVYLKYTYNSTDNNIQFNLTGTNSTPYGDSQASMTITKIEQYY